MKNNLTLYRRHNFECTHEPPYERDHRVYRPRQSHEETHDCECPIHAVGRLKHENGRICHKPLGTADWDEAEQIRKDWLIWGQTTPPVAIDVMLQNPNVQQAWDRFMEKQVAKRAKATRKKYDIMWRLRLQPFCKRRSGGADLMRVAEFNEFSVVEDFVASWRNMNPTRNRPHLEWEDKDLGANSLITELERFGALLNYCVKHGWVKENQTTNLEIPDTQIERKYGLTLEEVERVVSVIPLYPDCYGRLKGNELQQSRICAFVLTLRHTGLRIGDVSMFNEKWIKENPHGDGYLIDVPQMAKTRKAVQLPMDDELAEILFNLPFKCTKDGIGYWFWAGTGTVETATGVWQKIVGNLYDLAQELNRDFNPDLPRSSANVKYLKPFEHHTTPHTWRHTFAILSLNAGADIKDVSRWLGHSSVLVTERHYGHANKGTIEKDVESYRKMRDQQRKRLEEKRDQRKSNSSSRTAQKGQTSRLPWPRKMVSD